VAVNARRTLRSRGPPGASACDDALSGALRSGGGECVEQTQRTTPMDRYKARRAKGWTGFFLTAGRLDAGNDGRVPGPARTPPNYAERRAAAANLSSRNAMPGGRGTQRNKRAYTRAYASEPGMQQQHSLSTLDDGFAESFDELHPLSVSGSTLATISPFLKSKGNANERRQCTRTCSRPPTPLSALWRRRRRRRWRTRVA
jgi:hypothetical protein